MRTWLTTFARRWWEGGAGWGFRALTVVTAPLEWTYAAVVASRNRYYDARKGRKIPGVRVISLGNLTVGGTGKTPLAAWVAHRLASTGTRTALLTRGYGRDEILLHRRWNPRIPVVAHPDRVLAALGARDSGAEAVVLDDGFQHRRLARDVDLVLVAAEEPLGGRLLPRGPLREPPSGLRRAHGVIVTRRTSSAKAARQVADAVRVRWPGVRVGIVALLPKGWTDVRGDAVDPPDGPVLAVAGVARPGAFAAQVQDVVGGPVELVALSDHHAYGEKLVRGLRARARGRTVVVTEKDAVKLLDLAELLGPVRVMTQAIHWEEGEQALTDLIVQAAPRDGSS